MSRFQKIFLASALVIVGFVVAKFLGQPVLPEHLLPLQHTQTKSSPAVVQVPGYVAINTQASRARLLPETSPPPATITATEVPIAMSVPSALGSTVASPMTMSCQPTLSERPRSPDYAPTALAPFDNKSQPAARLRNEAPRPVGVDPQSPVSIRRNLSTNSDVADPYRVSNVESPLPSWSAPQLLNTGYSDTAPATPPATVASYVEPPRPTIENQVSPPPWPRTDESAEQRTHTIIDGDSLEKLAGRYLSDPERSREIYELNRNVLSAPDLLPIGAELKIPERVASASWGRQEFQPNSASTRANRESSRDNWIPIRPAASPQEITPRAQLAPPVMVQ